jgi:hypothetical protein
MTTVNASGTSALSGIISNLKSAAASGEATVIQFGENISVTLIADQATILAAAAEELASKVEANIAAGQSIGDAWDSGLTATYNDFYNAELAEGQKIALSFLNVLASVAESAAGVL